MRLYDILMVCGYYQIFHVYVGNAYDENIIIGHGTRKQIVNEEETPEGIDHLMDRVDMVRVCGDGSLVVIVTDRNYNKRAKTLYSENCWRNWDNLRPETRPWRHSCELECTK